VIKLGIKEMEIEFDSAWRREREKLVIADMGRREGHGIERVLRMKKLMQEMRNNEIEVIV
jgi:hypothetical protein